MRFAREGYPFMIGAALFAVLAWAATPITGSWMMMVASLLTLLAAFVFYFFRDPEREIPSGDGVVVCPGDGKIIDIREVEEPSFIEGLCRRITIFLSVFNVHVQRAPVSGDVAHREYRSGEYAVAWHPKASEKNEQSSLGLIAQGHRVLVRQIAGLIARRIVTYPEKGDHVQRGERIGLIRFGSRVDLFIPLEWSLDCAVGDKVAGGSTVLAQMGDPSHGRDDGLRDEGLRDDGLRDDGLHDDGMRDDGLHDDGMRDDGMHDDAIVGAEDTS
jgi:phosphatidylserine decarboxylase